MNKPHKHCELIKAWADGATIEFLCPGTKKWVVDNMPTWSCLSMYRIKPVPQTRWTRLYKNKITGCVYSVLSPEKWRSEYEGQFIEKNCIWVSDWIEIELYSEDE